MGRLANIAHVLLDGIGPVGRRELSAYPDIDTQIAAARRVASARSYRLPSVQEALGVPSILAACQLIAGTVGSLSMEAYQNGVLVTSREQVPRLLQRPNPKTTPREFWRDTAWYLATRGEAWWWVAARDGDGMATSLVVVPPWEVNVQQNPSDRFSPFIEWLGRRRDPNDLRQLTYMPGLDGLHGIGPLQVSLAAASVAIEADAWAANFFSGALPSLIGTTDQDLDEQDLINLDKQWMEKDNNLPRWVWNGLTFQQPPFDAEKSQLTESRQFQVGEVARMFGIPGPLLEYQSPGSALTYRNESDMWTQFINQALNPHYLEPMQQEISDLLTRNAVGKFNTDQLQRADIKTRFDAYGVAVDKRILDRDEARRELGYGPGNIDFVSVPPAPPVAQFEPIRTMRLTHDGRCTNCKKRLADVAPSGWRTTCPRCNTENVAA